MDDYNELNEAVFVDRPIHHQRVNANRIMALIFASFEF